jgi:hypothetical protein
MKPSDYASTICSCLHKEGLPPKSYNYLEPTLNVALFFFSEPLFILMTNCPRHFQSVAWTSPETKYTV